MENKKISIIVPVYNSAQFLSQCLDSLLAQTHQNKEIILICDDGKDDSPIICNMYAQKFPCIKYIHRTGDGRKPPGVSSARNLALQNLADDSTYIAFVDADDWVEPTFLQTLLKNMEEFDADLSTCGYKLSKPTQKHIKQKKLNAYALYPNKAIKQIIGREQMTFVLWNKLFKTKLAQNIMFDENIKFVEDTLWVYQYFIRCKRIAFCNQKLYHYIKHAASALSKGKVQDRLTEIATYEQISCIAETQSQTQKVFFRAWQYLMMLEKFQMLKKIDECFPDAKQKIIDSIKQNRKYFWAAKKDFVFYRKLGYVLEKLLGIK